MADPYDVLGVEPSAGDAAIRRSYLALVRKFPPERAPEEFRRVQAAYEAVRNLRSRLWYFLFAPSRGESLDAWIAELRSEAERERWSLERVRRLYCSRWDDPPKEGMRET
ncbi:MAG: DnaJ domain-containing protein [Planctomycetota bacterium]